MPILRNKYVATLLVFAVWMLFFDQNNAINQVRTRLKLAELNRQKEHYLEEISSSRDQLSILHNDREMLEKLARERYLMKKDNEDIFIIDEN